MRISGITVAVALTVGSVIAAGGQRAHDAARQAQLEKLFPAATAFSPKGGDPPHIKAYSDDPGSGQQRLLGFAFLTTELEPLERGYDGPIQIIVGMDTTGVLTGIIVIDHNEPYGDFSVEPPRVCRAVQGKEHSQCFQGRCRYRCGLQGDHDRQERHPRGEEQRAASCQAVDRASWSV